MVAKKAARTTKRGMSDAHKQRLAEGREAGRAIRNYLEALEAHRPRRGRKRTTESIERRLEAIERQLQGASPVVKLQLLQERMNLNHELNEIRSGVDLTDLEEAFVRFARSYSERNGISYAAWRGIGVKPEVLTRAGLAPERRG